MSELWQHDRIVQFTSEFKISNKPFVRIVSGVSARSLRAGGDAIRVSVIAALTIAGFALMAAFACSNVVLRPLRELLQSIKQLEAESKAQGDSEAGDTGSDLQLISNRIRELGRRFAGSRNEVEVMREQLEKVVGTVSQRVLLLDRNRHIILASPEAERLLNGGRVFTRGSPLSSVLSIEHPLNQLTERAFNLHQSLQQTTELASNGEGPTPLMASVQLFEDRGRPAGALLTLSDSKPIETFVDFAARQFQLNRITSGVAHEIKNPLHALVLHLELINAKLDSGLDPRPHVNILTNEVHRLKRVVQTLLDFTRPVELARHRIDANLLVREVIALAADARAQGVEIIGRYSSEPIYLLADTDLLQQAILNIVINGCQAMPDGGKLIIEVSPTGDRQVEISIRDFGPGIREEDREEDLSSLLHHQGEWEWNRSRAGVPRGAASQWQSFGGDTGRRRSALPSGATQGLRAAAKKHGDSALLCGSPFSNYLPAPVPAGAPSAAFFTYLSNQLIISHRVCSTDSRAE